MNFEQEKYQESNSTGKSCPVGCYEYANLASQKQSIGDIEYVSSSEHSIKTYGGELTYIMTKVKQ